MQATVLAPVQDYVTSHRLAVGVPGRRGTHQQGIDTMTPGGKAMFQMLGVFAEFERGIIRERILSGIARVRAEGKRLGRPTVSQIITNEIRALRSQDKVYAR